MDFKEEIRQKNIPISSILAEAREWLDTPWRHQGRSKGHGVDCVGLLVGVGRGIGISNMDDPKGYGRDPGRSRDLILYLEKHFDRYDKNEEPLPGDIILIRDLNGPTHVGIVAENKGRKTIIHADNCHRRRVIEHRYGSIFSKRIVAIYRLPGIDREK